MSGAVLIVDDSQTVRMNLMELLNAADLPTVTCATLTEARAALEKEQFSLVLLDVLLPDGDGIQLLQEIRATPSTKHTAVMLLSTEAEIRADASQPRGEAEEPWVAGPAVEAGFVRNARQAPAGATKHRPGLLTSPHSGDRAYPKPP